MKFLIYSGLFFAFCLMMSCSSGKDARQRRGLMMPLRSEISVNRGRYKEIDYSNRDKAQKKRLKEQNKKKRASSSDD